jgi:hypothetical protein
MVSGEGVQRPVGIRTVRLGRPRPDSDGLGRRGVVGRRRRRWLTGGPQLHHGVVQAEREPVADAWAPATVTSSRVNPV